PSTTPAYPDRRGDLERAMFSGTALALALVFFFEYIDNRVKSPEELTSYLGLPFLGIVPAVFGGDAKDVLLSEKTPCDFLESFRGLRTNVLFSSPEGTARILVVTSTGPGEGKTVISANLALALAHAGPRVLLIDADMRKSRVHEVFKLRAVPGLSNILVGDAKASEAIQQTHLDNLWVLPAGVAPPNPPELLGSDRFRQFLAKLE